MNRLEEYNQALRNQEDESIRRLNRVLDASFQRLVRRVRLHLKSGKTATAERNILILQELLRLVPAFRPDRVDQYDKIFNRLLATSSRFGIDSASLMAEQLDTPRLNVSIPLQATMAAARQARGYLLKWGQRFAATCSEIVAQGVAEGRPFNLMVQEMRDRLGVVKSRASAIVRTESLRAYNSASNSYYVQNNINEVVYYATADDRTCPTCAPRAGNIYRRGDISVPAHVQCRCFLAPWSDHTAQISEKYRESRLKHRAEVLADFRKAHPNGDPPSLNRAALFETSTPVPLNK